jgi:hypothetical protein
MDNTDSSGNADGFGGSRRQDTNSIKETDGFHKPQGLKPSTFLTHLRHD